MSKGPNTEEGAAESDEDPDYDDLMETVEWAVTTDNVEMVNLEFDDDGVVSEHFQLLGHHYNLTGLNETRFETVKSILDTHAGDIELEEAGYTKIEVDADIETHQELVVELLRDVYDTSPEKLERITRSTYEPDVDRETTIATCVECGDSYEVEYIMDAFGAEFYSLVKNSGSVGDDAVDMVYQQDSDKWMCKVCYNKVT
jgi:hypothetical protein